MTNKKFCFLLLFFFTRHFKPISNDVRHCGDTFALGRGRRPRPRNATYIWPTGKSGGSRQGASEKCLPSFPPHYLSVSFKEQMKKKTRKKENGVMWELSFEPEAEPIFSPCLKRLLPHASLPPSPTPSQSSLPFINHPWLVGQRALCWELSGVRTAVERTHTRACTAARARLPLLAH